MLVENDNTTIHITFNLDLDGEEERFILLQQFCRVHTIYESNSESWDQDLNHVQYMVISTHRDINGKKNTYLTESSLKELNLLLKELEQESKNEAVKPKTWVRFKVESLSEFYRYYAEIFKETKGKIKLQPLGSIYTSFVYEAEYLFQIEFESIDDAIKHKLRKPETCEKDEDEY